MRCVGICTAILGVVLACDVSSGQDEVKVPERALAELDYLVGTWKVEGRAGDTPYKGKQVVKWATGEHCLRVNWQGTVGDLPVHGTGVVGWDALEEQILDVAFIANVGHRTMRWTIETAKVWEGKMCGNALGDAVELGRALQHHGADAAERQVDGEAEADGAAADDDDIGVESHGIT